MRRWSLRVCVVGLASMSAALAASVSSGAAGRSTAAGTSGLVTIGTRPERVRAATVFTSGGLFYVALTSTQTPCQRVRHMSGPTEIAIAPTRTKLPTLGRQRLDTVTFSDGKSVGPDYVVLVLLRVGTGATWTGHVTVRPLILAGTRHSLSAEFAARWCGAV